ncbi:MAG: translocation/assembly module TamB domain-containing protein [Raineya sp.]|nr:translocation/assembly module TamB domain-containing protein [Raineya sp.]
MSITKQNIETQKSAIKQTEFTQEQIKKAQKKRIAFKFFRIAKKIFKWFVVVPACVILILLAILAIPAVQTYLAQKASQYFSRITGFQIKIEKMRINLINQDIYLKNLQIIDRKGNVMIDVEKTEVDLHFRTFLRGKDVFLDKIFLQEGSVNLIVNPQTKELNIDEFIAVIDSLTAPKQKRKRPAGERAPVFAIEEIVLNKMRFSYHDSRQDSIRNGFDYAHFQFSNLDGYLKNMLIVADTVAFDLEHLKAEDKISGLTIKNFTTRFLMNETSMQFNALQAEINNSTIRDSLVFNYESPKDFSDFNDKIRLEINFQNTILHTQDLALFAPELKKYDDVWKIKGYFSGTVSNFSFANFFLQVGQNTRLIGTLTAEGLPTIENLLASLQIEQGSVISASDLRQYLDENTNRYVQKLGNIALQGRFDGYFTDFKANCQLQTNLGNADLDTYFIQQPHHVPAYEGNIRLQNFQIGNFFDVKNLGLLSLDASIKGRGFSIQTLDSDLNGHIELIEWNNYPYHNIDLKGHFKNKSFEGNVQSEDENFHLDLTGNIDFNKTEPQLRISTDIQNLDFFKTHLFNEPLLFKGFLHVNSENLKLENFLGEVLMKEAIIQYKNKTLRIDSLTISSSQNSYGYRFIDLYSPYVTAEITGKYTLADLQKNLNLFINELILGIKNKESDQKAYYEAKKKQKNEQISVEFKINLFDINPLVRLVDSTFHISQDITLLGELQSDKITRLALKTEKPFEKLHFGNSYFQRNSFRFEAYKEDTEKNISAELNVYSNGQKMGSFETEKLSLNAIWLDGVIDFRTKIKQKNSSNEADLQGHITLDTNRTTIEFEESLVKVLEKEWHFRNEGKITLFTNENGKILFEKFGFFNEKQEIKIQGQIAQSSENDMLNIDVEYFQLATLNALLGKQKLKGTLNAHVTLQDVYEQIKINSQFNADSVAINQFLVGDLHGKTSWNNEQKILEIATDLYHKKDYVLFLTGYYKPQNQDLNLWAKIRNLPINIVEPFTEGLFSKLEGTLSSDLAIAGKIHHPELSGFARFQNAKFKVDFLGATYETNSQIEIKKNEFGFNHFTLTDRDKQVAIFNGSISHDNFAHFFMDLEGDFEKFTLLQIKETPNALFYGNAIATGKIIMQGEPTDLYIRVDATSNKGTKIYLPLDGYSEVSEVSYYQFVDFEKENLKDSLHLQKQIKSVKITGLELDMNLNVTEDAYFEIQLDRQTGDKMQGTGKGLMQLSLDKRGNFGIWGDYLITDGSYLFTMKNLISKKFNILPGSKIYFEGDVYKAYMDVKAAYNAHTSFTAFLPPTEVNPETSRRFPVAVVAHLLGDLLAPKVTFSIDFKEIEKQIANPTLQAAMFKVKSDIETNELELNRQVGSLVILGQFTSASNNGNVGAASGRTLGEFLSNQFSNIVSQIDENLEIDISAGDLIAAGQNNSTVLGARFAYNLMDGRLRIISDNRFNNQQRGSNYTGEWIVEYLMTEDGRYKLKMYNRSTFGNNSITNTTANSTGVSISTSRSGNTFWELFQSKKKKETKRKKTLQTTEPSKIENPQ